MAKQKRIKEQKSEYLIGGENDKNEEKEKEIKLETKKSSTPNTST